MKNVVDITGEAKEDSCTVVDLPRLLYLWCRVKVTKNDHEEFEYFQCFFVYYLYIVESSVFIGENRNNVDYHES